MTLSDTSYIIYDLSGVGKYMVSANVSVCYEPSSCVFTDIILIDVRFPKPTCNYQSTDYNLPGNDKTDMKYILRFTFRYKFVT